MSRGPDPATWFERELAAMANAAGLVVSITTVTSEPWLSATFAGTHLALKVEARDTATFDRWLTGLPEAEFRPARYLVADLSVARQPPAEEAACADLTVLIVENC